MKKIFLVLYSLLCVSIYADNEEKVTVATAIVEATGVEGIKTTYANALQKKIEPLFEKFEIAEPTQRRIREVVVDFSGELTKEELQEPLIESYVASFTLEELRGIRDFFESAAGQALLKKTSQRELRTSKALVLVLEKKSKELVERIRQEVPELQK